MMRIGNPPSDEPTAAHVPGFVRSVCHSIQLFSQGKGHNVVFHSMNVEHGNLSLITPPQPHVDHLRGLFVAERVDAAERGAARKHHPSGDESTVENNAADGRRQGFQAKRAGVELLLDVDLKGKRVGTESDRAAREISGPFPVILLDQRGLRLDGGARRGFRGVARDRFGVHGRRRVRVHRAVHHRFWSDDVPVGAMVVLEGNEGVGLFSGVTSLASEFLFLFLQLRTEVTRGDTANYGPIG